MPTEHKDGLPIIQKGCSGNLTFSSKITCEDPGFLSTRTETTRPNPSLSPTCAAAGIVWVRDVLKPLLEDLLPIVEDYPNVVIRLEGDNNFSSYFVCRSCHANDKYNPADIKHNNDCLRLKAQSVLPRLLKAIKELSL